MTDGISLAISFGSSLITVVGVGIAIGRLDSTVKSSVGRLDKLESESGTGSVSRADLLARITQVERNTASVDGLKDRLTKLETSTEIHHADMTKAMERLDRGQQGIQRMMSTWMTQGGSGKLMIVQPTEPSDG